MNRCSCIYEFWCHDSKLQPSMSQAICSNIQSARARQLDDLAVVIMRMRMAQAPAGSQFSILSQQISMSTYVRALSIEGAKTGKIKDGN